MRKLLPLILVLVTAPLIAATKTICASGCDQPMTPAGLQAALDSAACGDIVTIQAGGVITFSSNAHTITPNKSCPAGSEIVITSSAALSWLPQTGERITPAYLSASLLPTLNVTTTMSNSGVLNFYTTGAGRKGYILRGIAIKWSTDSATPAAFYGLAIGNLNLYSTNDANEYGGRVYLERVLLSGTSANNARTPQVPIYIINNEQVTLRDSYAQHLNAGVGIESYVTFLPPCAQGPLSVINNALIGGFAIGHLSGGSGSSCLETTVKPQPNGIVYEYNWLNKPWRYYPTSPNYVGDSNLPFLKNCFELKLGDRVRAMYNQFENCGNGSGGQRTAFVATLRNLTWKQSGTASQAGTVITITGYGSRAGLITPRPGLALGICTSTTDCGDTGYQYEFRNITAVSGCTGGSCQITVDTPYSSAAIGTAVSLSTVPWGSIKDVTFAGNYIKNVPTLTNNLGIDETPGTVALYPNAVQRGLVVKNNIVHIDSPLVASGGPVTFPVSFTLAHFTARAEDYLLDHNTYHFSPTGLHPTFYTSFYSHAIIDCNTDAQYGKCRNLTISNNLAPSFIYGGYLSSGYGPKDTITNRTTGSSIRYNTIIPPSNQSWGASYRTDYESCPGGDCRKNFFANDPAGASWPPAFKDAKKNDWKLLSISPFARRGENGSDVGADSDQVALIRNLSTSVTDKTILFRWELPPVLARQVCVLEVSPNSGLVNDDGDYTVVNALRPDYFQRGIYDSAARYATSTLGGGTRYWQVGLNGTVTDDQSTTRDLALTPNTTYYYRLMCGGGTERGSIKTSATASASGTTSMPITHRVSLPGASKAAVSWGDRLGSMTLEPIVSCAPNCTLSIPNAQRGRQLVYFVNEYDAGNKLIGADRTHVALVP